MPRLGSELPRTPGGDLKAVASRPIAIGCLAFSPDGSILAGGDSFVSNPALAVIHLWDVAGGRELRRIPAHQQSVKSLSFAPDGKVLASTGAEPVIRLWDVATGREVHPDAGPRSALRSLAVSPADGSVFTGGDDGTVRRWDPSSGRELGLIARLVGPVEALAVAPDGESLLVVSPTDDQPEPAVWISRWSVAERREIRRLAPIEDSHALRYIAYSPDGKVFASEGRIRDALTGDVIVALRHEDPQADRFFTFCPIFFTPDGRQVLTAEPDGVRAGIPAPAGRRAWPPGGPTTTIVPPSPPTPDSWPRAARSQGEPDDPPNHSLGAGLGPGSCDARGTRRRHPLPPILARWPLPGIIRRPSRDDPSLDGPRPGPGHGPGSPTI